MLMCLVAVCDVVTAEVAATQAQAQAQTQTQTQTQPQRQRERQRQRQRQRQRRSGKGRNGIVGNGSVDHGSDGGYCGGNGGRSPYRFGAADADAAIAAAAAAAGGESCGGSGVGTGGRTSGRACVVIVVVVVVGDAPCVSRRERPTAVAIRSSVLVGRPPPVHHIASLSFDDVSFFTHETSGVGAALIASSRDAGGLERVVLLLYALLLPLCPTSTLSTLRSLSNLALTSSFSFGNASAP
ncbi:hypothetical protein KIN20_009161 [Parelaphostrongylus tenuis]|uniref:Secreted protein n=1 Tax=Parelaphostrongylus tenuis TaxID=148309 RepID=A0AAD5M5W7_PARTN|nr:hypothetical protein KIN20_009161 [Parelaphostrongylus tenuis]